MACWYLIRPIQQSINVVAYVGLNKLALYSIAWSKMDGVEYFVELFLFNCWYKTKVDMAQLHLLHLILTYVP